ncbi:hypothetical protein XNC3_2510001 [Xenorhabdus nematophila F1]|nr:hypothetical protein XNC3_2510001 [Xenorhabdus nematophila F1]
MSLKLLNSFIKFFWRFVINSFLFDFFRGFSFYACFKSMGYSTMIMFKYTSANR